MNRAAIILICLLQVLNSGCASIVKGSQQTVQIETNPPGAIVRDGRTHKESVTPTALVLKKKYEYEIEVTKPGYKTEYVEIDRHLSGWFWANLLFGGIVGMIIDVNNGAGYKLEPEEVHLTLKSEGKEKNT